MPAIMNRTQMGYSCGYLDIEDLRKMSRNPQTTLRLKSACVDVIQHFEGRHASTAINRTPLGDARFGPRQSSILEAPYVYGFTTKNTNPVQASDVQVYFPKSYLLPNGQIVSSKEGYKAYKQFTDAQNRLESVLVATHPAQHDKIDICDAALAEILRDFCFNGWEMPKTAGIPAVTRRDVTQCIINKADIFVIQSLKDLEQTLSGISRGDFNNPLDAIKHAVMQVCAQHPHASIGYTAILRDIAEKITPAHNNDSFRVPLAVSDAQIAHEEQRNTDNATELPLSTAKSLYSDFRWLEESILNGSITPEDLAYAYQNGWTSPELIEALKDAEMISPQVAEAIFSGDASDYPSFSETPGDDEICDE